MKEVFFRYQAQTSPFPLALEISKAKGSFIFDYSGKKYLDFVAGVSANSVGHCHDHINQAIIEQSTTYAHVMVYGEFVQKPQVMLCKRLSETIPKDDYSVYLTNSGTEAAEGAIKLAKRVTQRTEIIAAKNSYHGNTMGSMSVSGVEKQNRAFRPLVPGTKFISYNCEFCLQQITNKTAAVILETIQGGAGFITPRNNYLQKVKEQCERTGTLLILDEIQTGIGRTGAFWGFESENLTPDIIITGKGLGGGMPIGAFIAKKEHMDLLKENPMLGHISTFAGHPVIAAAANATLDVIENEQLIEKTVHKEKLFRSYLQHELIEEIRGKGLMLAIILKTPEIAQHLVLNCLKQGLILFFLLFEKRAARITPPLTISDDEIKMGCEIILKELDKLK